MWDAGRSEGAASACGVWMREKPDIPHRIVAIGFDLGVLLALDFNGDESCVHFSGCIMIEGFQWGTFFWRDLV